MQRALPISSPFRRAVEIQVMFERLEGRTDGSRVPVESGSWSKCAAPTEIMNCRNPLWDFHNASSSRRHEFVTTSHLREAPAHLRRPSKTDTGDIQVAHTAATSMDMRTFARNVGTTIVYDPGQTIFKEGDLGDCMYIVQQGSVEMVVGTKVVDVCGPGDALGFMAVIDRHPRTSTAIARDRAELSIIDDRRFKFMIDEVPNFAVYIMTIMAHRIRGMSRVIAH